MTTLRKDWYKEYLAEKRAEADAKAKEYFNTRKAHQTAFRLSGDQVYIKEGDIFLDDIDPTPRVPYSMSVVYWNPRNRKMSKRIHFEVELEDEEYLYLLTEQLVAVTSVGAPFTFNTLVYDRPELARKISKAAETALTDGTFRINMPYLVIFDEVLSDVEAIAGPWTGDDVLYSEA